MPLYKTFIINSVTTAYVWKITEDIEFLKDIPLSENSSNRLKNTKSIIHQKGYLSIRHLLKYIGLSDNDLFYNEFGKPLLKTDQYISITHSFDFSAIVISDKPVGIDMEKNREKVLKIAHRFSDFQQNGSSEENFIKTLTLTWAAKESLYKIHPCGGMSFKNDLIIDSFNLNDSFTKGKVNTPELVNNYLITFNQVENYSFAVATTL